MTDQQKKNVKQNTTYPHRIPVLIIGLLINFLQGGLVFGWPTLSLMLKKIGVYSENCPPDQDPCKSQEKEFSLDWNAGVFASNFGPLITGFVLDHCGPKFTTITATLVNVVSLVLFALSSSYYQTLDTYPIAMFGLGLGGIGYHVAQFHKADAFPSIKGRISSCFNGAFAASAVIPLVWYVIWRQMGETQEALNIILYVYAGGLLLLSGLLLWSEPNIPITVFMEQLHSDQIEDQNTPLLTTSTDQEQEDKEQQQQQQSSLSMVVEDTSALNPNLKAQDQLGQKKDMISNVKEKQSAILKFIIFT
eukprot:TRINITY_DN40867_c0_g1_i1.p1 TRINITY_DN40867_c0_g1~~TRINITY_DN40867_c0_g1_i1.p1  ORF type:complete len:319 (-),score=6.72 TRINITY_DN40867_c0_g1_i1:4-918(-)